MQGEVNAFERLVGNLETTVKSLASDQIPVLERQIDEAMQAAEEFLKIENADEDTRADVQQEYQRRMERQPVEVVIQNATRYENEYQSAE